MATCKRSLKRDFCEVEECAEYQPCPKHREIATQTEDAEGKAQAEGVEEGGPSIERSARLAVGRADVIDKDPLKCNKCWTLTSLCYCERLQKVDLSQMCVWVYTHYLELTKQRASNTGKLICLTAGGKKIIYGIPEEEAVMIRELLKVPPSSRFVLYPCTSSIETDVFLQRYEAVHKADSPTFVSTSPLHVVIFDGTWGQAKTLLKRFTSLCSSFQLCDTPYVSLMHASRTDFGPLRKLRMGGLKAPSFGPVPTSSRRPDGCYRCRSFRHRVSDCPLVGMKCFTCGLEGHSKLECSTPTSQFVCTYCSKPGHLYASCQQADQDLLELGISSKVASLTPSSLSNDSNSDEKQDKQDGLNRVSTLGAFAQLLTELHYPSHVTDTLAHNLRLCIDAYRKQCPSKPQLLA